MTGCQKYHTTMKKYKTNIYKNNNKNNEVINITN